MMGVRVLPPAAKTLYSVENETYDRQMQNV